MSAQDDWRDAHRDEMLTMQQVSELPYGTLVEMVWSGGNGPHRYRVHPVGETTFAVPNARFDPSDPFWLHNPIEFVGTERFHTNVIAVTA